MSCREETCWCHDDTAQRPIFCSHCGCEREATQEELRQHLMDLGMPEERIGTGEIPQGVILISNRPLTPAEQEYAKSIEPTLGA